MKKLILSLALVMCSMFAYSQTYISVSTTVSNSPGTAAEKISPAFEVGQQFGVFSLGFDYGKTSLANGQFQDTTSYLEIRPNLNIFQQGKFTNTLTIGIGYVSGAQNNFLTEVTSGVEIAVTKFYHINLNFGQYYYSGKHSSSSNTFVGFSIIKYFNN